MTLIRPPTFSAATHPGLKRDNNEDSYLSLPDCGLWLVADGMGGHEAGEVASAIVKDTIKQLVEKKPNISLSESIKAAHNAVLQAAVDGIGAPGMGSTVVAMRSRHSDYEVAWVGDSRAYLWTQTAGGGHLEQLTTDHSYVQMLLESGAITADEVDKHPEKNIITQCIGSQELKELRVDTVQGHWHKHQWILLCSDGLTDELDDKAIAQVLCDCTDSATATDLLLATALNNGGNDNITLQIIESPLAETFPLTSLWQWVPYLTGSRRWDGLIYVAAIVSLLALLYSIIK